MRRMLLLLLLAAMPTRPYGVGWGYYPSGEIGIVLLILLLLLLVRRRV